MSRSPDAIWVAASVILASGRISRRLVHTPIALASATVVAEPIENAISSVRSVRSVERSGNASKYFGVDLGEMDPDAEIVLAVERNRWVPGVTAFDERAASSGGNASG